MLRNRWHFMIAISLCFSIAHADSGNNHRSGYPHQSESYHFLNGAVPYFPAITYTPSSPDNWLGGTGNWSNGADWSAGLPGQAAGT